MEEEEEEEVEYVMLDLESIFDDLHIPPNAPYVLSGLDTLNPILIIDNKIKLSVLSMVENLWRKLLYRTTLTVSIGEYEETIGTCLVFNESEADPVAHEETGPSEANLFRGKCIVDPTQTPTKQVNPITSLNKVLKFRLFLEADSEDVADKQVNRPS